MPMTGERPKPSTTLEDRRTILSELCLTEEDLLFMGAEQRQLVEDVVVRMARNRHAA